MIAGLAEANRDEREAAALAAGRRIAAGGRGPRRLPGHL